MEFNRLPDNFGVKQKRRTEWTDPTAKLQTDAVELIERAVREGVSPLSIKLRSDDNEEVLHRAIAIEMESKCKLNMGEGLKTCSLATDTVADPTEFAPRLARFKADYDRWNARLKAKLSWEKIQARLLANNALKLSRAEAMNGVMFGVDNNGKAVFAPEQKEPEMTGMNYTKSREAVMFETDEEGKKTSRGYELFDEALIKQFEQFTGHPVVASENEKEWRSIWLESGEKPGWIRVASFGPDYGRPGGDDFRSRYVGPRRGVRRLLRV